MLLELLIAVILSSVLVEVLYFTVDYLSTVLIRNTIRREIPESGYALIEKITNTYQVTEGPSYRAKVYDRHGSHIKNAEFSSNRSEYFYHNEKISVW